MIFNSALFVVLALVLSSTSANVQQGTLQERLMDKISSVVADKLIQVANNATDNTSDAKMETKLLNTIGDVLSKDMQPEMKELQHVSDNSPDQVAENLALQISENVLSRDEQISPRSLKNILKVASKLAKNKHVKDVAKVVGKSIIGSVLEEVKNI